MKHTDAIKLHNGDEVIHKESATSLECSGFLEDCVKCTRKKTDCPIKDVKDIDHHIGGWILDMGKPEKPIKKVYESQPLHVYGSKK